MPEAAVKKVDAFIPKLESMATKFAGALTEAKSQELKKFIPQHVLVKAEAFEAELADFSDMLANIKKDGCGKVQLKGVLAALNPLKVKAEEMTEKIATYVEDAEEAAAAAAAA